MSNEHYFCLKKALSSFLMITLFVERGIMKATSFLKSRININLCLPFSMVGIDTTNAQIKKREVEERGCPKSRA